MFSFLFWFFWFSNVLRFTNAVLVWYWGRDEFVLADRPLILFSKILSLKILRKDFIGIRFAKTDCIERIFQDDSAYKKKALLCKNENIYWNENHLLRPSDMIYPLCHFFSKFPLFKLNIKLFKLYIKLNLIISIFCFWLEQTRYGVKNPGGC